MVESTYSKYPYNFCNNQKQVQAFELPKDYKADKITSFLMKNVDQMFEKKKVHAPNDWLATQNEAG